MLLIWRKNINNNKKKRLGFGNTPCAISFTLPLQFVKKMHLSWSKVTSCREKEERFLCFVSSLCIAEREEEWEMKSGVSSYTLPAKRRWKGLVIGVLGLVILSMLVPLVFLLGLHNGFHSPGNSLEIWSFFFWLDMFLITKFGHFCALLL